MKTSLRKLITEQNVEQLTLENVLKKLKNDDFYLNQMQKNEKRIFISPEDLVTTSISLRLAHSFLRKNIQKIAEALGYKKGVYKAGHTRDGVSIDRKHSASAVYQNYKSKRIEPMYYITTQEE
jgi:hypothetical protein